MTTAPYEITIQQHLPGGFYLFKSIEQASLLANTLILRRSPLAGHALTALDHLKRIATIAAEEVEQGGVKLGDPLFVPIINPNELADIDGGPLVFRDRVKQDFFDTYRTGGQKFKNLVNRAVRSEYPEGNPALELVFTVHKLRLRLPKNELLEICEKANKEALAIADALYLDVVTRYGFNYDREGGPQDA